MNQIFNVVDSLGNEVFSTANGTYYSVPMNTSFSNTRQLYIEFYSDAAGTNAVTPTAGTVSVFGTPMGNAWLQPSTGATIDATQVTAGLPPTFAAYTVPQIFGRMARGAIVLSGVTGAAYARAFFWSFGE